MAVHDPLEQNLCSILREPRLLTTDEFGKVVAGMVEEQVNILLKRKLAENPEYMRVKKQRDDLRRRLSEASSTIQRLARTEK